MIQRIAAISVALILLCATAVAQNEKNTKSVTSHGVVVSNSNLTLTLGEVKYADFVVELGYRNPVLIYLGQSFDINDGIISGNGFIAEILTNDGSSGRIRITADLYIDEVIYDVIYVKAMMINNGSNRLNENTTRDYYGVPIYITINPNINNKPKHALND